MWIRRVVDFWSRDFVIMRVVRSIFQGPCRQEREDHDVDGDGITRQS